MSGLTWTRHESTASGLLVTVDCCERWSVGWSQRGVVFGMVQPRGYLLRPVHDIIDADEIVTGFRWRVPHAELCDLAKRLLEALRLVGAAPPEWRPAIDGFHFDFSVHGAG